MKTTRKQLVNFAIGLIKEVTNQSKHIKVEYQKRTIDIWFHSYDKCELISMYLDDSLTENKAKFKKAILKIRGIIK